MGKSSGDFQFKFLDDPFHPSKVIPGGRKPWRARRADDKAHAIKRRLGNCHEAVFTHQLDDWQNPFINSARFGDVASMAVCATLS